MAGYFSDYEFQPYYWYISFSYDVSIHIILVHFFKADLKIKENVETQSRH